MNDNVYALVQSKENWNRYWLYSIFVWYKLLAGQNTKFKVKHKLIHNYMIIILDHMPKYGIGIVSHFQLWGHIHRCQVQAVFQNDQTIS